MVGFRHRDGRLDLLQIRRQRFFANDVLFVAQEQPRLREVQGVRAGDINRVNGVALRQRLQRGKQMLDRIVIGEGLRLFEAAGVDGGKFIFAGFMGGIDKLLSDPVCANNCETYHKR